MSDYETLEITRDGSVMTIALNRPEKMNTFNTALRREIARAAIEADLDKSVRAVILTGNGGPSVLVRTSLTAMVWPTVRPSRVI